MICQSELMLRHHNMIRNKMHRQYNESSPIQGDEWIITIALELMNCKREMATCGCNYHEICALLESVCVDLLLYYMCCI